MNYKHLGFWLLAMVIVFQSCQSTTSKPVVGLEKPYFDLKSYFEKEKMRLATVSNFKKTTVVDGKEETKQLETINFNNEFRIFADADINRPAWFDKYLIDSILQDGNLTRIDYTAKDAKMEMQKISVDFDQSVVQKISIQKAAETALADTQFELIYEPKIGYSIENTQQLTVGEDKSFFVKDNF